MRKNNLLSFLIRGKGPKMDQKALRIAQYYARGFSVDENATSQRRAMRNKTNTSTDS